MKGATRFAMQRLVALDRAIRPGKYPNASSFAREMEVDARTIQRDVEFLRDRFNAPVTFDSRKNGYRYDDPDYRLTFVELREDELIALFLAEGILKQYRGTSYAADLAGACRKIAAGISAEAAHELAGSHSFRVSAPIAVDARIMHELGAAVRSRTRLSIRYDSASADEESDRLVDPYHLAHVDSDFYLIAFCHRRGEVRTFAPSRIRAVTTTGQDFPSPDGFDVDHYLAGCFAVLRGPEGQTHRVRLRFTGEAIRYARERTWHPTQQTVESSEDALLLEWEVGHLREVERFALSWGDECEVLGPPELRERVARILSAASARYLPTSQGFDRQVIPENGRSPKARGPR